MREGAVGAAREGAAAAMASGDPPRQRLVVTHLTTYVFASAVIRLSLILRLWPEPYAGLSIRQWQVTVNDVPITPSARNAYGERTALWSAPTAPGPLTILARGVVEVEDTAGVVAGLARRLETEIFLRATPLTKADKAIAALMPPLAADRLAWLHGLMQGVHAAIAYVTGSTHAHTSAAEALADGEGVCQDHAHVFIAAARAHGVPARYVCGYVSAGTGALELHETHAWAEAYVDGIGWIGFDASRGLCPTQDYVRLATGLDARDAAPIRGHAVGGGASDLFADVRIAPSGCGEDSPQDISEIAIRMQQQ